MPSTLEPVETLVEVPATRVGWVISVFDEIHETVMRVTCFLLG